MLFFAAGLSSTIYAGPAANNYAEPTAKFSSFDLAVFENVLRDTQQQAQFASKVLGNAYEEPSNYAGQVAVGGANVNYNAEHGFINWQVVGTGVSGTFNALEYFHDAKPLGGWKAPNYTVGGIVTIILVLGAVCAYLSAVATNNCIRACGINGVASSDYECGNPSRAGCQCNPSVQPIPTPGPYPGGDDGTGPYFNGYMEYQGSDINCMDLSDSGCGGGDGGFMATRDTIRAQAPGQGWMNP